MLRLLPLYFLLSLFFLGCDDDDDNSEDPNDDFAIEELGDDVNIFATNATPVAVYDNIIATLSANEAIGIVAEVNHQQNAANNGLELPFTRTILFGNPTLGTPIMQANQLAGLDLPQKMVTLEVNGETVAAYNAVSYLRDRHGISNSLLEPIETALSNIVNASAPTGVFLAGEAGTEFNEGIIEQTSTRSFDATFSALVDAITTNENLILVDSLDHQANAASVDLELRPTKLIIFGNPDLGTPLMQNNQGISLDLPQKMLVYEMEDGTVRVAYNDPDYLADRFDLGDGLEETLTTIAGALDNLATAATGN
ncbi:hypothetical protein CEQ90_16125 [Lewinellaceae bacterium SD302]|nr:hypothetical protein CEQ90_16125 [Lewinellaceae bacterium SD302]